MNNYTPHLKPPNKIQIRRAALGQPEMKLLCGGGVGGLGGGGGSGASTSLQSTNSRHFLFCLGS